jgi:hypothetical protein
LDLSEKSTGAKEAELLSNLIPLEYMGLDKYPLEIPPDLRS